MSELALRRLDRLQEQFGEQGAQDVEKFGHESAGLLHLLDVPDGIRVSGRLAKLITARESGCLISWQTGRKTAGYGTGGKNQMYEPAVEVPLERVKRA